MILEQGRPADCAERLTKEVRVYDLLDKLNIPYHRIDHEEANTMEICQALEAISVETLTPIEAMNELYKLKKMLN